MTVAEELRVLALKVRWADGLCDIPPSKTIEALAARVEALAGAARSIEGCDTRAEIEAAIATWASELAP